MRRKNEEAIEEKMAQKKQKQKQKQKKKGRSQDNLDVFALRKHSPNPTKLPSSPQGKFQN
jgi:hypothetical protein